MKRLLALAALTLVACNKAPAEVGPPSMPAAKVRVEALAEAPLERTSDALAALSSRRSITLYSQASGYLKAVAVKPGASVKQGQVLLQVDGRAEQAALENLVATREALVASAALARQRLERATTLRGDGIVSQQDAEAARAQVDQAEASLRATDALLAAQRARLGFFTITAPFDGVVGHVPVKPGDLVTPATPLTTLTQESGLEAEVWVPVERLPELSPASRIRLLDDSGAVLGDSPVTFVASRPDPASQLLLIKAAFAPAPGLVADRLVKARVVWSVAPGLSIPTVSVLRQAGATFVYVAEGGEGGPRARRVPVVLGPVQGDRFVLASGLDAGMQVVVSGVQMVGDGAPVDLAP